MANMDSNSFKSLMDAKRINPVPPPLPRPPATSPRKSLILNSPPIGQSCVSTATTDLWKRLFEEGYKADVCINTDNGGIIYAHSNILGMTSPVMRGLLKQAKRHHYWRIISISGVPRDAV